MAHVTNNLLTDPDPLDTPVNRGDIVVLKAPGTGQLVSLLAVPTAIYTRELRFLDFVGTKLWNGKVFLGGTPIKDIDVGSFPVVEVIPSSEVEIILNRV